jgi:quinol monooxygenase YgiN
MSVIVIGRMTVNPDNVKTLWSERTADFEAVATEAKAAGALHHRWGFGDGHVLIVDEWADGESFQKFFTSNPLIQQLMQSAGVQGEPEVQILTAEEGPDQF